jgi:exosortase/archaeosortase family protein
MPGRPKRSSTRATGGAAGRGRRFLVVRAWLVFVVTLGALQAFLEWIDARAWDGILDWTARGTAWGLSAIGTAAVVEGRFVAAPGLNVEIIRECTAVHPAILLLAAIAAYPSGWRAKLLGVAFGLPLIVLVNFVRIVGICQVGIVRPAIFETAHMLVGQTLIVAATLLIWLGWAILLVPRHAARPA